MARQFEGFQVQCVRSSTTPFLAALPSMAWLVATSQVRHSVIKEADKSIQSVLKTKPPAGGFFFGDPSNAIHTQLQFAFLTRGELIGF